MVDRSCQINNTLLFKDIAFYVYEYLAGMYVCLCAVRVPGQKGVLDPL